MERRTWMLSVACMAALGMSGGAMAGAESKGTAAEATAMVDKAIAFIKKAGRAKAFAEISDQHGQFVDRDLYVVVYDLKGKVLAHGANARMIGKDLFEIRDNDGKYFVKERIDIAKGPGKGWQDYKFPNPVTHRVEPKSMFIERFEDLIVGCGIYKG